MNKGLILSVMTLLALACNAHEEAPQETTRFFWSEKVDESLVIHLMKLMNYCLAQKIESEAFYTALIDINNNLKKISCSIEEKKLLQQRVEEILDALAIRFEAGRQVVVCSTLP